MKDYGPAEMIEQNIKNFRANAATAREEAARKMNQAEQLERQATEWESALAILRGAET